MMPAQWTELDLIGLNQTELNQTESSWTEQYFINYQKGNDVAVVNMMSIKARKPMQVDSKPNIMNMKMSLWTLDNKYII